MSAGCPIPVSPFIAATLTGGIVVGDKASCPTSNRLEQFVDVLLSVRSRQRMYIAL